RPREASRRRSARSSSGFGRAPGPATKTRTSTRTRRTDRRAIAAPEGRRNRQPQHYSKGIRFFMKRILFLLALFSLAVIVGNATAAPLQGTTAAPAPDSTRERRATSATKRGVELFVYSGRENPTWDITSD